MREVESEKRQLRRVFGVADGNNTDFPVVWKAGKEAESVLAEIFALPVVPENVLRLNDASGNLIFVAGISDPGGDDILT